MKRIFVGSSNEARKQAESFVRDCDAYKNTPTSKLIEFVPWWTLFPAGFTVIHQVLSLKGQVDAAILLLTPDVKARLRGHYYMTVNQNVLLEFGFFLGALPIGKTAGLTYGNPHITSDLGGFTHIHGSKFYRPPQTVPIAKRTKTEFDRWFANI